VLIPYPLSEIPHLFEKEVIKIILKTLFQEGPTVVGFGSDMTEEVVGFRRH
jgi:hypothetical protein